MRLDSIVLAISLLFPLSSCGINDPVIPPDNNDEQDCIAIVPDIQYYTNNEEWFKYLDAIVEYCSSENNGISFLIQTGDVTNNNRVEQWNNGYQRFFSRLPQSLPVVFCLGNHDYGSNGSSAERESNFLEELTPVRDVVMPGSKWDNYLRYVMLGKKKIAILSLEFAPRNEALLWADEVIKANRDVPVFILTHAFLNNSGKMFDSTDPKCDNKYSQKYYKMGDDYLNDSKEIFDKIIYNNPNVKMVICGHCISDDFIECLEKKNVKGDNVYCIMVNFQHYKDGGSGYMGLLFHNQGHFNLRSFNAVKGELGRANFSFDITL